MNEDKIVFNKPLYNELCSIDEDIPKIIFNVYEILNDFDSNIFKEWEFNRLNEKIEQYLLQFILPNYEIIKNRNLDYLNLITAQLLCCVLWRYYDNCLDDEKNPDNYKNLSKAIIDVLTYGSKIGKYSNWGNVIYENINRMTSTYKREIKNGINYDELYKRCSVYFSIYNYCVISKYEIDIMHGYINYLGIIHDLHDILADYSKGIKSLPIQWLLRSNNGNLIIDNKTLKKLYENASFYTKKYELKFMDSTIKKRYPITYFNVLAGSEIINNNLAQLK